jgi:hypothetical protein
MKKNKETYLEYLTALSKVCYNIDMAKTRKTKTGSAIHLAALQSPARVIQSRPKVASKAACRRNKWGRYDD